MRERHVPTITASNFDELPHTLTLPECAALCSVAYGTACNWLVEGKLRGRKAGGTWLVEKTDLLTFAQKRKINLIFRAVERAL